MRTRTAALVVVFAMAVAGCGGGRRLPPGEPAANANAIAPEPPAATSFVTEVTEEPAAAPPLLGPGCGTAASPGLTEGWLDTGGGARRYLLYVPPGYDPAIPAALIVNFHGSGNRPEDIFSYSRLSDLSDHEGFILLTPEGSGNPPEWDVYGVYGEDGADDTGFVRSLLDDVSARFCIDADRIYAAGLSNGAEMASQLGCTAGDRFAAIAPVAGIVYQGCEGPPVPIITFHGTDDYNIPFEYIPGEVALWAAYNGCTGEQLQEQYTEHVERWSWEDCAGNDVDFYVVLGGGHTWPGAEPGAGGAGEVTGEISANELMWVFFQAHPKRR